MAAIALLLVTACVDTSGSRETVSVTPASLAAVPAGGALELDLARDVTYAIDLGGALDVERVLLRDGASAVSVGAFLEGSGLATNASLEAACDGGWTLECQGNVCCTVCQSSGEIGACKGVQPK